MKIYVERTFHNEFSCNNFNYLINWFVHLSYAI